MSPDTTRVQKLVDLVQSFLGEWLDQKLKAIHPEGYWQSSVLAALDERQERIVKEDGSSCPQELDLPMQVTVFRYNWPLLLETFHLNRQLYNDAVAVKQIRNKYDHKKRTNGIDLERYRHDIETVYLFLKELNAPEEMLNEARSIQQETASLGVKDKKDKAIEKNTVSTLPTAPLLYNRNNLPTNSEKALLSIAQVSKDVLPLEKNNVQVESDTMLDWIDVAKLLWEDINASIKLDLDKYQFGECKLLGNGDSVPYGVELSEGWQTAVVLHIKSDDREKIMHEVSRFNKAIVKPYLSGEYAVWQFPRPIECKTVSISGPTPEVFLPKWLTDYIYVERELKYMPNREGVQYNLGANKEFSLQYLATYFPRSFAEISSLCDYVFLSSPMLKEKIDERVSILDVGCGSGAAALAIMWSLKKARIARINNIVALGLDGNQNFLDRFRELVPVFKRNWSSVAIDVSIGKTNNMESALSELPKSAQFDFVVSSKFIQELDGPNTYAAILKLCLDRLKPTGVLILLENYREGRTEANCRCAEQAQEFQVNVSAQTEFSIMQIPGCPCVQEQIGYQIFINQGKEEK